MKQVPANEDPPLEAKEEQEILIAPTTKIESPRKDDVIEKELSDPIKPVTSLGD